MCEFRKKLNIIFYSYISHCPSIVKKWQKNTPVKWGGGRGQRLKLSFCNSFPDRRVSIMARIHAIEIFYASSNPAIGKFLLTFSEKRGREI